MRSLALAQAAEAYEIPCHFLVDEGGKAVTVARHDWVYPVKEVPQLSESEQAGWLLEQAVNTDAAAVIVDGYNIPASELAQLHQQNILTVVMDDGQMTQLDHASIIVNSTTQACDDEYRKRNPNAALCTGSDFRLMRREFQQGANPPLSQRHGIALSIGGSDPRKITVPLLDALGPALGDVQVRVITGPAFSELTALDDAIARSPLAIQHIHNCQDMAEVWRYAKLAISAAGGSQFELGVCETPSVLLMVAENQRIATEQAAQEGWCLTFDCTGEPAPVNAIAEAVATLWHDQQTLQGMQDCLAGKYVSDGAFRVLDIISQQVGR